MKIKKILFLSLFFLAITSCVDYNQKNIDLTISLQDVPSNLGNYKKIQVKVFDTRPNRPSIGTKQVGDKLVTIGSAQDLVNLVTDKITEGMAKKGFAKGDDKILEVYITTFEYKAERKFFIGHSKADIVFKIVVKDKYDNNKKYQKSYSLAAEKDHFIMPLITTDQDTINQTLQEVIYDIFQDNGLIENLKN